LYASNATGSPLTSTVELVGAADTESAAKADEVVDAKMLTISNKINSFFFIISPLSYTGRVSVFLISVNKRITIGCYHKLAIAAIKIAHKISINIGTYTNTVEYTNLPVLMIVLSPVYV